MVNPARDKTLFTPGPLTTSQTVRQAMLRDLGSRDTEFIEIVRGIRQELLRIAGADFVGVPGAACRVPRKPHLSDSMGPPGPRGEETRGTRHAAPGTPFPPAAPGTAGGYEAILVQGSGTFGVESVISSVIPPDGKLLVLINGAYGERIAKMAAVLKIPTTLLRCPENEKPGPDAVRRALADDPTLTHVAAVHCETTTGILNPIEEIGPVVRDAGRVFILDAMSSFGAIPVELAGWGIDFLISSANKCVEGVPGFAFVLARRAALLATEGYARSMSLDLLAQWQGLERDGQFRFTPPTHALLAFAQALRELEAEGGIAGRAARYRANREALLRGMRAMGFREYLHPEDQGDIITAFYCPADPRFHFVGFYDRLNAKNLVIYPGKLTHADCFRIGTVGRIFEADVCALLAAIRETLAEMGIAVPVDESR